MVVCRLEWPVLVVAVMLGGSWAFACPQGCSCRHQRNLLSANCSSLPYNGGKLEALTLLPRDTPVELSDGQFNLAKHLKYLTLKNSSIYFVHKKAFYGAKKILEIDLSFNYIEELDPTVFQHLINLTRLSLRGNPIHFVSEMPFLISNSLSHLDIGQCKIRTIPRGIFYELKRLTYLSLDGNNLKSIVYNSLPKGLKYLDLSNNHMVNVPTEVIAALTNIGRLGLAGNPVNCSCSLMNFQDWLSGKGVIFEDDVICNSPHEYKGVSWSKVDENKLCLVEAKREEMHYSSSSLMKNGLYKEPYNYKHFYLEENVQSDQPGLVPDSQVEVFMKNDDTLAMGEMMRDEEEISDNKEEINENKDLTLEEIDKNNPVEEKDAKVKTVEVLSVKDGDENADITTTDDETINNTEENISSPTGEYAQSNNSEIADLNSQENVSKKDNDKENIINDDETSETPDEGNVNNSDARSNLLDSTKVTEQNGNIKEDDDDIEENIFNQTQSTPTNENSTVEFKNLNEEEMEVDEFKKEGLFHVVGSKYRVDPNATTEESTVIPEVDDATEDEFSGQGPIVEEDTKESYEDAMGYQNVSSTSEINNGTFDEEPVKSAEEEVIETVPPPVVVPNVYGSSEVQPNATESDAIESENTTETLIVLPEKADIKPAEGTESPGHETPTEWPAVTNYNPKSEVESSAETTKEKSQELNEHHIIEDKIKEMAGAEVVMFCVAILVICLILYSVYKCRSSTNRENMRSIKDLESNRGTELQDMASLLPKTQEEKKNNLKYDDKAPSSETVKLLTEQNENESANCIPNPEVKNKIEDKNSLNNNTPNSPSKTPLIKPEKPVSISPASPIQRTKVKVGIIPDSIPRTPIFLQKSYNGTKNV